MMVFGADTMPPNAAALSTLDRVSSTIAVAHGLAVSGRPLDLAGLDAATGLLCAQVLDLPPLTGAAMRPALHQLDLRLAALVAVLKPARL